jgi:hypothetical protein
MLILFLKRASVIATSASIVWGCCPDDKKPNGPSNASPASKRSESHFDQASSSFLLFGSDTSQWPPEQKELYEQLNPTIQPIFMSFSPEERADAVLMSKPMQPANAIQQAAKHDVFTLPYEQQALYFSLSPKEQALFLALSTEATEESVKLAQSNPGDEAVQKAAAGEVSLLPRADQDTFEKLNIEMKTLFLALTPQVREAAVNMSRNISPNTAVKNVSWMDAKRLPKDQQEFYEELDADSQTLFLILTPNARSMALQLTKQLDPNTAVQYAYRGSTKHFEDGL